MPSIQPEADGKFWLNLQIQGRFTVGVKLEHTSPAAAFVLGDRSQENLLALKHRIAGVSRHFADYIRADLRLELRGDSAVVYA